MACSNSHNDNLFEDRLWQKEMTTTSTIEKWPILKSLPPTLASRVRMAAVFGKRGEEAIFLTNDDEAFGLGNNRNGRLGVGHENKCLEPTKIKGLTNVKVKTMAFGVSHVVAVTEEGSVLAWGGNHFCQLGNGNTNNLLTPEQVSALNKHRIVDVACGALHTLVLTEKGEVFAWGKNNSGQLGLGSTDNPMTPMKVTEVIGSRRAVAIGCCNSSSFVVMDNGEVYIWGYYLKLGLEHDLIIDNLKGYNNNKLIPTCIEALNAVKIRQLVCGEYHMLALAVDGSVYGWGYNRFGQLGIGDQEDREMPVKIEMSGVRFVAVAASIFNYTLSSALSEDGRCWVWGESRSGTQSKSMLIPEPVKSSSLHDAFAEFGHPQVTWKPFLVRQPPKNRTIDRLMSTFDDPTTSDFKFIVDGKQIHLHRSVLKTQCQHFRMMFSGEWSESVQDEVEVEQWSYPVYYAFLKFLYTDEVDLPIDQIIQLIDLANFYLEFELEIKCHRLVRQKLSIENAALAYAFACVSNTKSVQDYCFRFIKIHLDEVEKTERFQSLEEEIKNKFSKTSCRVSN